MSAETPTIDHGHEDRNTVGASASAAGATGWRRRTARLLRQPAFLLAALWLLLILLALISPGLLAPHDPNLQDGARKLLAPSPGHLLGTDEYGRDLFSRIVWGSRESLKVALLAVLIGLVVGIILGLAAGALRGIGDAVVMRLIDAMLAVPSIIISLAIVSALGRGAINVAIAIGVTSVGVFARLVRAEALHVRASPYFEVSVFAGHPFAHRAARHILPNSLGSVVSVATVEVGAAILAVATLSFLGFGEPPPTPEWGALVAAGRSFMFQAPWLVTAPGVVILLTVFASHTFGRALRNDRVVEL